MDKIASFTVNHLDLIPGVYVSRKDYVGKEVLTTFDLRMTAPNREPVMNTAELHTIEHLAATYLRNNDEWKEKASAEWDRLIAGLTSIDWHKDPVAKIPRTQPNTQE